MFKGPWTKSLDHDRLQLHTFDNTPSTYNAAVPGTSKRHFPSPHWTIGRVHPSVISCPAVVGESGGTHLWQTCNGCPWLIYRLESGMSWITPIATNYSGQYERAENLKTNSRAALSWNGCRIGHSPMLDAHISLDLYLGDTGLEDNYIIHTRLN